MADTRRLYWPQWKELKKETHLFFGSCGQVLVKKASDVKSSGKDKKKKKVSDFQLQVDLHSEGGDMT